MNNFLKLVFASFVLCIFVLTLGCNGSAKDGILEDQNDRFFRLILVLAKALICQLT